MWIAVLLAVDVVIDVFLSPVHVHDLDRVHVRVHAHAHGLDHARVHDLGHDHDLLTNVEEKFFDISSSCRAMPQELDDSDKMMTDVVDDRFDWVT